MSLYRPYFGGARQFLWKLAALLLQGAALHAGAADSAPPSEYEVKAAFIYNFAKFVQWPAASLGPTNSIILGILGDESAGSGLEAIEGKVVGAHSIHVRRFRFGPEIGECHILFILPSERLELPAIIQSLQPRNVLTICDAARDFPRNGAIINLIKTPRDKIRFEINVDAARRAELKIQSPLLNLAKIVRDPKPEP